EIGGDDLSGKALAFADPNQDEKVKKLRSGFVKLRGVQVNAQRSPGQLRGCRIREGHTPGNRRGLTVAASGGKTSQPANRVTQGQTRPQSVQHRKHRHFLEIRIQTNHQDGADDAAVKSSAGLKGVQAENVAWICNVKIPVTENQPDFRQEQRGE